MWVLETRDGDIWNYNSYDDARRDQYIFGGVIIQVKDNE